MILRRREKFLEEVSDNVQRKRCSKLTYNWRNNCVNWIELDKYMKSIVKSFQIYQCAGFNMPLLN